MGVIEKEVTELQLKVMDLEEKISSWENERRVIFVLIYFALAMLFRLYFIQENEIVHAIAALGFGFLMMLEVFFYMKNLFAGGGVVGRQIR